MKVYKKNESSKKEVILDLQHNEGSIRLVAVDEGGERVSTLLVFPCDGSTAVLHSSADSALKRHGYSSEEFAWDGNGCLKITTV